MAVRLKDIAEELNVSVVTVSKVLRNQGDISSATRQRVLKLAKELNYQPNWIARSLVTRKTFLIGLVFPDLMHSFFAEIAHGVSRIMRASGYNVVICYSEEDAEVERREIEGLLSRRVDGLIVASAQAPRDTRIFKRIENEKVPYVLIDRRIRGMKANFVGVSDELMGRVAVEHLVAQGCRRLAHIRGPQSTTGLGRLEGFLAACADNGIAPGEEYVVSGGHSDEGGFSAMQKLLTVRPRPDGVVCYNDPTAAGALRAAIAAGLRVPEDIAMIGAGNVHYSDFLRVPLSTVDQHSTSIGESAANLLLEIIQAKTAPKPRAVLLEPTVVARDSSRKSPAIG